MRIELLDLIQCPICSSQNLEINVVDENDVEIRKGSIICLDCHAKYIIQSGIPNLLVNPSKEILDEQEGWTQLEKGEFSYYMVENTTNRERAGFGFRFRSLLVYAIFLQGRMLCCWIRHITHKVCWFAYI
jgi:uncharacterized protein YbaR (Trm112 family)